MATINNLYIDQGTTFSVVIQVFDNAGNPLDISEFIPYSQIRKSYSSNISVTFNASIIDTANGNVQLSLSSSDTRELKSGRYVYDLNLERGDLIVRASEGIVTVYPQVTRSNE
jgi:hypothetical protein